MGVISTSLVGVTPIQIGHTRDNKVHQPNHHRGDGHSIVTDADGEDPIL